jgi:hypothetical protein
MTDDQAPVPGPDPDEPPGWQVIDPDGNVIDSGPMAAAQPAFDVGQTGSEGGQE